jgi:heme-degrading monooxygenase HmoA
MIAVIFELTANEGYTEDYFDLAASLKPLLDTIDGFVSIERFQSLADPARYLSLSFWRDETALGHWRNTPDHRAAQTAGRASILKDYRLRIADVRRGYDLNRREEAPSDSRAHHG